MLGPEVLGSFSFFPFKGTIEIGYAGKAAGERYIGNGIFCIDEHPGCMPQADIIEEIHESNARLYLEESAKGRFRHIHQLGYFIQADGPVEIYVHEFDQLLHAKAIHIDIIGIIDLFPGERAGAGGDGQFVQDGHQFQHGPETCLLIQGDQPRRNLLNSFL